MRLTVLKQMTKGLGEKDAPPLAIKLERVKWFLWHGNTDEALQIVGGMREDFEVLVDGGASSLRKLTLRAIAS